MGKERERDLDGNLSNVRLCRTSLDDVAFFLAPLRRVSLPSENVPCYGFLPISHFPLLPLSLSLCIPLSFFFFLFYSRLSTMEAGAVELVAFDAVSLIRKGSPGLFIS